LLVPLAGCASDRLPSQSDPVTGGPPDLFATGLSGELTRTAAFEWLRGLPIAHPGGRLLYAASALGLESLAVDPATGVPLPRMVAPHAHGAAARLAVHPSGAFVYSVSPDGVLAYGTDEAGSLHPLGRVAEGGGPIALVRGQ
jgi:hypothetical protein